MPKLKTRRSAAKRFKRSGGGKFMRRKAFRNHMLEHKTTARKSRLAQKAVVSDSDSERVSMMLPYA